MSTSASTPGSEAAVYRRITWRIMPYLFLCYVLAYVDRVNVGFAKLTMQQDLGLSDSAYGLGAGIFFIGYFLFEVPANMILHRIGARRWIGPLMMAWGIVSACTLFVKGAASFYALRFLLGIVESGFFPGVILYLTYWYTQKRRARMVALFMSAVPISGMVAGPISGWILARMTGTGHLSAWQWLFLLEGIPSVVAGLVTLWFLTDRPSRASWLAENEKSLVLRGLEEEDAQKLKASQSGHRLMDAFRSAPGVASGSRLLRNVGGQLWHHLLAPADHQGHDHHESSDHRVDIDHPRGGGRRRDDAWGHHSDKTGERRWHMVLAGTIGAVALRGKRDPRHFRPFLAWQL